MTTHEGFTPGPWEADHTGHIGKPGLGIARLLRARGEKGLSLDRTDAANAALIADAPRLYAENQRMRDTMARVAASLEADGRTADGCTKADAAIRLRAALNGED